MEYKKVSKSNGRVCQNAFPCSVAAPTVILKIMKNRCKKGVERDFDIEIIKYAFNKIVEEHCKKQGYVRFGTSVMSSCTFEKAAKPL